MGKQRDYHAYNLVALGNRRRLRHLLGRHAELRTSDTAMLVFAAIWHNRGMLRWLLERGVSPDCRLFPGSNTPLMQAAMEGDMYALRLLLEFGADVRALNEYNENPLGFAVTSEQIEAISALVEAGADVNDTVDPGPDWTHLDWAEMSGWTEVARVLIRLGAKRKAEL